MRFFSGGKNVILIRLMIILFTTVIISAIVFIFFSGVTTDKRYNVVIHTSDSTYTFNNVHKDSLLIDNKEYEKCSNTRGTDDYIWVAP